MSIVTVFELAFAAGVGLAATALGLAATRTAGRRALATLTVVIAGGAVAAWVAFALRLDRDLLVTAGGLTGAALAAAASFLLSRALDRSARVDDELDNAQATLLELVEREVASRAADLDRVLARARAESVSLLAEEERRIAEERRALVVERERAAGAELVEMLSQTQKQVEQRLEEWSRDLDRAATTMRTRLVELGQRQRQLTEQAEQRLAADGERLAGESDEQRQALVRLRAEIEQSLEASGTAARAELEAHAGERRRALHELGDRLRRRERELHEQIEREEAEAVQRIQAGFQDVGSRQIEQLQRSVARAAATYSDEAAQQFSGQIKAAREEAARRLARELERAVAAFAREAESVLAERLAHVGDAGAQRLERRLSQIGAGLERQRDDFVASLEQRVAEAEAQLRRQLTELAADAEAERAILEARVQEVARRLEELGALAQERLATTRTS